MKLRKIVFVLSVFIMINSSIGCKEVVVDMRRQHIIAHYGRIYRA